MLTIFKIIILIISVIIHEVSHGYAAEALGDPTARYAGRLTLNPIPHIDLFGSIILPLLLALTPGSNFIIGWAKPVPYNPYNLRNQRWGEALVAVAGPAVNILIALIFGLALRVVIFSAAVSTILQLIVFYNLLLAVFNLVPIPPLDGSKILFSILPYRARQIRYGLERYGFFLVLLFVFFFWHYLSPVIFYLFTLITGLHI